MCGNTAVWCGAAGPVGRPRTTLPRSPEVVPCSLKNMRLALESSPQPGHVARAYPQGPPTRAQRRRRGGDRVEEHTLLDRQQSAIEVEELAGKPLAGAELRHPAPAFGPDVGVRQRHRHQIFSTLTRNALNSGVRAFASPTNGVSA